MELQAAGRVRDQLGARAQVQLALHVGAVDVDGAGAQLQRRGLGRALMRKMLAWLRARGTRELRGICLRHNDGMTALAHGLGFEVRAGEDETMGLRLTVSSVVPR